MGGGVVDEAGGVALGLGNWLFQLLLTEWGVKYPKSGKDKS